MKGQRFAHLIQMACVQRFNCLTNDAVHRQTAVFEQAAIDRIAQQRVTKPPLARRGTRFRLNQPAVGSFGQMRRQIPPVLGSFKHRFAELPPLHRGKA